MVVALVPAVGMLPSVLPCQPLLLLVLVPSFPLPKTCIRMGRNQLRKTVQPDLFSNVLIINTLCTRRLYKSDHFRNVLVVNTLCTCRLFKSELFSNVLVINTLYACWLFKIDLFIIVPIINTLCSDSNMKVVKWAPNNFGCLEALMTFGPLKHDLRHCLEDPSAGKLIPIDAFNDEIYAKGCLKVLLDGLFLF